MPTELQNPPQVSITVGGKPIAEYDAEQKQGFTVTQALGEALCKRIVRHGRVVTWRGRTYTGGEVMELPPEEANRLVRLRDVQHPGDYDDSQRSQRAPSVRQVGNAEQGRVQGPNYDTTTARAR